MVGVNVPIPMTMAFVRRLEALAVWRSSCMWRGRHSFLYPIQELCSPTLHQLKPTSLHDSRGGSLRCHQGASKRAHANPGSTRTSQLKLLADTTTDCLCDESDRVPDLSDIAQVSVQDQPDIQLVGFPSKG